jgi:hypothetical protein
MLPRKVARAFPGKVVAHHVVAAALEISCHRRAHIAEADESDASGLVHDIGPVRGPIMSGLHAER